MSRSAYLLTSPRPAVYLAILSQLKQSPLEEEDFIRFNSLLAEKLELIFGTDHAKEYNQGAYATFLSLTQSKASTAQVVSEVEKTHLAVDFLTTFFTLQYYVEQVYNHSYKVEFVRDWRECVVKVGKDMITALNQLAEGAKVQINLTPTDLADMIKKNSRIFMHPNTIRALIKVHGDRGYASGVVGTTLRDISDELEKMPIGLDTKPLSPDFNASLDKSPVDAYLGSLTYALSDSEYEGGHHSSIIVHVGQNLQQFSLDQINQIVFKAVEADEDFEWLIGSDVITDIQFRVHQAVSTAPLLKAHESAEHYSIHISNELIEQCRAEFANA